MLLAGKNPVCCLREPRDDGVGLHDTGFAIPAVDESNTAARSPSGFHVSPAVADHEARLELDLPRGRRLDEETRLRLPAVTSVRVIVRADPDVVERNGTAQAAVVPLEGLSGQGSSSDLGLVRDDDEEKAGGSELPTGLRDTGEDLELALVSSRTRDAIAHVGSNEHAVAVEEDGAVHARSAPTSPSMAAIDA